MFELNMNTDVEEKRRNFIFYFVSYIGGIVILGFALQHINSLNNLLKTQLFTSSIIIICNVIMSHFYQKKIVFTYIGGVIIIFFALALVYSGGYDNTGLYWVFPFPFVLFVLLGYRVGALGNAVLFVIIAFMLANQQLIAAEYRSTESSRFLAAFVVTAFLMLIGEYFRHKSQREMESINIIKDRQANTDPLTGLHNRRFLDSVLIQNMILEPARYFPLVVIAVDIDHFKMVNDTYGHHAGDQLLKQFSKTLVSNTRSGDVHARIGGEEFIILFTMTEPSLGHYRAEKLRQAIEDFEYQYDDITIKITASFGVSGSSALENYDMSLKEADINLYQAKNSGRNQIK